MSTANLESSKYAAAQDSTEAAGKRSIASYFPALGLLLVLGIAGLATWKCYQQQDFVAASAVVVITLGALNGYRRGVIGLVISLMAFAVAFHFAPQFGLATEDTFSEKVGTTGVLNRGLAVAAAGVLTYVSFNLFSSLVLRILVGKPSNVVSLNHCLGFLTGAAQSVAAVLFFLGGCLLLEPTLPKDATTSALAQFAGQVQGTRLRPWVDKYNPFVHIPQLNRFDQVQKTVAALSDPKQVKQILQHPSIKELRDEPETREAMLLLIRDPEVSQLLKSDNRFDETTVRELLQNEAVLNLLDQPGFMDRASKVITEL